MFQNQNHNKMLFEKLKSENAPEGMVERNGKYFYGRVLREKPLTIVGFKNKKCLIIAEGK